MKKRKVPPIPTDENPSKKAPPIPTDILDEIPLPKINHPINDEYILKYINSHIKNKEKDDCLNKSVTKDLNKFEETLLFFMNMNYISTDDFLFSLNKSIEKFEEHASKSGLLLTELSLYIPPYPEKSNGWVSQIVYHLMSKKPKVITKMPKDVKDNQIIICDDMVYQGNQLNLLVGNYKQNIFLICPFTTGNHPPNITCFTCNHIENEQIRKSIYFQHKIADCMSVDTDKFNLNNCELFDGFDTEKSIITNCKGSEIKNSHSESKCPKSPYKSGDDEKKDFVNVCELKKMVKNIHHPFFERKISEKTINKITEYIKSSENFKDYLLTIKWTGNIEDFITNDIIQKSIIKFEPKLLLSESDVKSDDDFWFFFDGKKSKKRKSKSKKRKSKSKSKRKSKRKS